MGNTLQNSIMNMLEKVCVLPMNTILKIIQTKESDKNKLIAIQVFCIKNLETINKVIKEKSC